jgi:hypothetical protein
MVQQMNKTIALALALVVVGIGWLAVAELSARVTLPLLQMPRSYLVGFTLLALCVCVGALALATWRRRTKVSP